MNAAIVLSGGVGTRLGANIPKQYIEINGKCILEYSLSNFFISDNIQLIVIVLNQQWKPYVSMFAPEGLFRGKTIVYTHPGETRQMSILNGLTTIRKMGCKVDKVIIHDGARPSVSLEIIDKCIKACNDEYMGVMPVIPVKDTIYFSKNGTSIESLLDRSSLFSGQAPEAFHFNNYLNAHYLLSPEKLLKINGSSELAHLCGMKIKLIQGDPENYKITDSTDLERFKLKINESKHSL